MSPYGQLSNPQSKSMDGAAPAFRFAHAGYKFPLGLANSDFSLGT
jgi:hypothetical protein